MLFFFQMAANIYSHFKVHLHLEIAYHFTKKKFKKIRYSSLSILVIAVLLRFYQDQIFQKKILILLYILYL